MKRNTLIEECEGYALYRPQNIYDMNIYLVDKYEGKEYLIDIEDIDNDMSVSLEFLDELKELAWEVTEA